MNDLEKLNLKLNALVLFRNLLKDDAFLQLSCLLSSVDKPLVERVRRYCVFVARLFEENSDLTGYILSRVLADENIYVLKRAQGLHTGDRLDECLANELKVLEELSQLGAGDVQAALGYEGYLPSWETRPVDLFAIYAERLDRLSSFGYGIFSKYHMFAVKNGAVTPVLSPDSIRLSDLKSYAEERQAVIGNTIALLKGRPAANVLLYGDAGTGKSSTVKAVVNEYRDRGLRLVEITKKQFEQIPAIVEELGKNPLKFILFIDDLSFSRDNDDFGTLKAILEGSVSAKSPNLAVYATSNRRHLVKESFSDRSGDDIHRNETIQEIASLSERFGLSVSFFTPDKKRYLEIVHGLKGQYGIRMNDEDLDLQAERYALQRSGRSPRIARQFIEHLKRTEE